MKEQLYTCYVCNLAFKDSRYFVGHYAKAIKDDTNHFVAHKQQKNLILAYAKQSLSSAKIAQKDDIYLSKPSIARLMKDNLSKDPCPVCNKVFVNKVGISSHIFKQHDDAHKDFINQQNQLLDKYYRENMSCTDAQEKNDIFVATEYITKYWRKTFDDYKERKSFMNSRAKKKMWASGQRTISPNFTNKGTKYDSSKNHTLDKNKYNKIKELFSSDLTHTIIAEQVGCDPKTVIKVFKREFTEDELQNRLKRSYDIRKKKVSDKLKFSDEDKKKLILKEFRGDKGLHTLEKELSIASFVIARVWKEAYGEKAYEDRRHKMKLLNTERSAKTRRMPQAMIDAILAYFDSDLSAYAVGKIFGYSKITILRIFKQHTTQKEYKQRLRRMEKVRSTNAIKGLDLAGILGSKNEILFYEELCKANPYLNIIHHDLDLVPSMEIDVTIPSLKIAIEWDGPFHWKPIKGSKKLKATQKADRYKDRKIKKQGYKIIRIKDDGLKAQEVRQIASSLL